MKLLSSFLALGLTYSAIAWLNETQPHDVWVTVTTDILTTFCASKTQFAYGSKTYTATASQTLTITGKINSLNFFTLSWQAKTALVRLVTEFCQLAILLQYQVHWPIRPLRHFPAFLPRPQYWRLSLKL